MMRRAAGLALIHPCPLARRAQEAEDLLDYEAEEDAGAAAAKPAAGSAAAAGAAKEKKCGNELRARTSFFSRA